MKILDAFYVKANSTVLIQNNKISFLVKKLMAPNPSPFTLFGTGTFIIGRKINLV